MDETKNLSEELKASPSPRLRVRVEFTYSAIPRRSGATGSSAVWVRAGSDGSISPTTMTSTAPWRSRCRTQNASLRPEDVEAYLNEARILARLDHPNIVPVFDVGRTEDGLCFVVSKLVEGSDLAVRIETELALPSGIRRNWSPSIAEALHYAHTRGLVHRDIKPANILIDASGKPCVADFGLALKDEDFGKGGGLAGTPCLHESRASQGRGAPRRWAFGHLQPGRRLLRVADRATDHSGVIHCHEIIEQVTQAEARPPRQIDDTIPKELERICLKALSKRASERYTHRQGHGGRPAPVPPNRRRHGLACRSCGSREHPTRINPGSRSTPVHLPTIRLRSTTRSRSCRRDCDPSTSTMPTSSWSCCPDLGTGMDCPRASGSGRERSSRSIPTRRSGLG